MEDVILNDPRKDTVFVLLDTGVSICRLCLCPSQDLPYSILDQKITEMVQFCYKNISLIINQALPNNICNSCVFLLKTTFNFLNNINFSNNTLNEYITLKDDRRTSIRSGPVEIVHEKEELDIEENKFEDIVEEDLAEDAREDEEEREAVVQSPTLRQKSPTRKLGSKLGCKFCNKKYKFLYDLTVHERLHTGEKPFSCDICSETFISPRHVRVHKLKLHKTKKGYIHKCQVCDNFFPKYAMLRAHSRIHSTFKCTTCETSFTTLSNLNRHALTHSTEKRFECNVCKKQFSHNFSLKLHERRLHTDERLFICEKCGKGFNTSGELTVHVRVHTKEKPYKCTLCERAFSNKAALNFHTKIHTGERRHPCIFCDKKFRSGADLKVHMRVHTDERPYKCHYADCDKNYKKNSHLNIHLRVHTGERQHKCGHCGKSFGERNTLRRHLKTH